MFEICSLAKEEAGAMRGGTPCVRIHSADPPICSRPSRTNAAKASSLLVACARARELRFDKMMAPASIAGLPADIQKLNLRPFQLTVKPSGRIFKRVGWRRLSVCALFSLSAALFPIDGGFPPFSFPSRPAAVALQ